MQGILKDFEEVIAARPLLTISILFIIACLTLRSLTIKPLVPQSLPWVGRPTGPFAEIRASFSSFNNVREWLKKGYSDVRIPPYVWAGR